MTENAWADIIVVDARNPDFAAEPGDERWGEDSAAPIAAAGSAARPNALNLVYDRPTKSMDLGPLEALLADGGDDKAVPIVTHCGGGGRGQKAKDFLEAEGYTNVLNGGGPQVPELWEEFGGL